MAFTYSGDPASSEADLLRFKVGDTDEHNYFLEDGEITYILSQYSTLNARIIAAYESMAAKAVGRPRSRKLGPQSESFGSTQEYFLAMAQKFKSLGNLGSISIATHDAQFSIGMHDNGPPINREEF